eukprot:10917283-Prorocentrum_lima.AAC.1
MAWQLAGHGPRDVHLTHIRQGCWMTHVLGNPSPRTEGTTSSGNSATARGSQSHLPVRFTAAP